MRYKYITYQDRQRISTHYLNGERVADIAAVLDHNQRMAYDPTLAQRRVQENLKRRGKPLK